MIASRALIGLSAMALVAVACAEQGVTKVTASLPFEALNWNKSFSVPQFDNPYVTLTSVDLKFSGTSQGSMKFENRDPVSRSYSARVCTLLDLMSPSGATLLSIHPKCDVQSGTLPKFDGTLDYAGTSGASYTPAPVSETLTTTVSGASLTPYIGNGNVALPIAANVTTYLTVPGNFASQIRSEAAADVELTYTYTFERGSLGDTVFNDLNRNGIQDAGEPGIGGVKVILTDKDGKTTTTATGSDGKYLFDGLIPGEYAVKFVAPDGAKFTFANVGDDALDSDADADGEAGKTIVHSGENVTTVDAGLVGTSSLGDRAFLDANNNGVQDDGEPGLSGVGVSLLDASGNVIGTTTTNEQGLYRFEGLFPGSYAVRFDAVGGYSRSPKGKGTEIGKDSDADADGKTATIVLGANENRTDLDAGYFSALMLGDRVFFDANCNGVQDDGERGLEGVKVLLLDRNGNPVLDANGVAIVDVTDGQGAYLFTDLRAGDYKVKFVAPAGYQFTARGVGNDRALDSDVDSNGLTQVIGLSADNLDVDAGLFGSLCLGDRVWRDYDKDGLQDSCEPGVPGVKVTLLDAKGNVLDTRTTDKYGYYKFANLAPGDYSVDFDAPDGYGFTKQFADSRYKAYDSNVDPATGRATVELGSTDLTIDAGLVGALKIGDTVWLDCDGDGKFDVEQGEKGLANVRVYLLGDTTGNGKANVSAWTTTDKNGRYQFLGLTPGLYQVTLNGYDLPKNVVQTTKYGSNNPNVGLGRLVDRDNLDFDFGYKPVAAPTACHPNYWSCNVPKWAWDCLWIGKKCQTKATVCAWLKRNDCGDKSIALYQRLCAAKLNVGNGCNGGKVYTCGKVTCSLKEAIRRADDWMSSNPVGCKVWSNSAKWASICDVFAILDAHCNGK